MKERIRDWLKRTGHSREWLAERVAVKKRTVDNWLSSPQEIPEAKQRLIENLMADDAAEEAQRQTQRKPTNQIFSVEVDLETFRAYSESARDANMTLEEWVIDELNRAAEVREDRDLLANDVVQFRDTPQPPRPLEGPRDRGNGTSS